MSAGDTAGFTVLSFRQWAASDLTGNLLRGVLAEYLVAQAINAPAAVRSLHEHHRQAARQPEADHLGSLVTVATQPVSYEELSAAVSAAAREP